MAEEEFTGMYELLDALEAALKTADPAQVRRIRSSIRPSPATSFKSQTAE